MAYLAPSILSADLLKLEEQIKIVEANGADFIHVDVMDGNFVPNITFGPVIVKTLKKITKLPLDVHLMIIHPEKFIEEFAKAGASIITVHQETCPHLDRTIQLIKEFGCKAGVTINPSTPVNNLDLVLSKVDLVLIMSVNPGFGGQKFIPYSLNKIEEIRMKREMEKVDFLIEVDGGVNEQTAQPLAKAGVDVFVAGHAIFGQDDIAQACITIKKLTSSIVREI